MGFVAANCHCVSFINLKQPGTISDQKWCSYCLSGVVLITGGDNKGECVEIIDGGVWLFGGNGDSEHG